MGASKDVLAQIQYQQEENEKNRTYNAEQAEISRQWSTNERLAQQAYNTSERVATQEYNSPEQLSHRLSAAGINPAVYFSGSGPSQVASQPQSSSIPSAATANFSGGISPVVSQIPQLINSFGDLAKNLSNLPYNFKSLGLLDAQIGNLIQSTSESSERTTFQKFQNDLNNITKNEQIKEKVLKVALLKVEKSNAEKQGDVFDKEVELKKAMSELTKSQKGMTDTQKLMLDMEMDKFEEYLTNRNELQVSEINKNKAQTSESYASAQESSSRTNLNRQQFSINEEARQDLVDTIKNNADKLGNEAKLTNKQKKYVSELLEIAEKDNDSYYYRMAADYILKYGEGVVDAIGLKKKLNLMQKGLGDEVVTESEHQVKNNDGSVTKTRQKHRRKR